MLSRIAPSAVSLFASLLLAVVFGMVLGATLTAYHAYRPAPVVLLEDKGTDVPVVRIEGIENGALVGSVAGEVRVSAREKLVTFGEDGRFAISDRSILTNRITVQAPPGMRFVASSKGTKYYAVDSAGGQNIVPQNRVYFATEQAAQAAGYKR
jgi:hypothetical protein